ncbi:hypothetical protein BX600DRAFT_511688 [Xylariales sp. PMI_506]|nr:hypothetical protein BX600DRAFT_511688 [Xylariales sp. PMI_506]
MAPLIPRMHLFEINDLPWFPPYLRARVQDGLAHAWTLHLPFIEPCSPAMLVAQTLRRVLGSSSVSRYTFIDFCAGAGGPTPAIERALNGSLESGNDGNSQGNGNGSVNGTYAAAAASRAIPFVLTDLHPHPDAWARLAKASPNLTYEAAPVDAAAAPAELIARYKTGPDRRVFRLFNLAFHHFEDDLARAILRDTVRNSDGFGIFELQERSLASFASCALFGFFILLIAPFLYWWSPARLFFVYVFPVVPFVLVFDGLVSSLRTRTPEEVEVLLRTCGADTTDWVIESGRERFLWPVGYLNWIICTKRE